MSEATELTVVSESAPAIVEADPALVVSAFRNYQQVQNALDQSMPECIMTIKGKRFRKKQYWRAIATAFNLNLEMVSEVRETIEGKPISHVVEESDWGYQVVYRATASNGRSCDGDGSCYASEKTTKEGYPTAMMGEHNVRAHAHTRAKNRAIADLVGFGEVSAEEIQHEPAHASEPAPRRTKRKAAPKSTTAKPLSDEQKAMLNTSLTGHADRMLEYDSIDTAEKEAELAEVGAALQKAACAHLGIAGKATAEHFEALQDAFRRAERVDGVVRIREVAA